MIRFCRLLPMLAILIGAAALLMAPAQADAAFRLRVTDVEAGLSKTVTDNDLIAPSPPGAPVPKDGDTDIGGMMFTIRLGDFKFSVTGTSKPFLFNNKFHAEMDITAIVVTKETGVGSGTARIELTDTDFNITPVVSGTAYLTSTIGGTGNVGGYVAKSTASVDYPGNSEFGSSFTVTHAPPILGPGGFNSTKVGIFGYTGGNFSMTTVDEVYLPTASASVSFDHDVLVHTPAPASLILAGIGGLSFLGFRLRGRKVTA